MAAMPQLSVAVAGSQVAGASHVVRVGPVLTFILAGQWVIIGGLESLTVTVAWQVPALPAASLTCKVTVCAPVSPQPKLTESAKLASLAETVPLAILCSVTPQLSVEPFSMAVALTRT